MNSTLFFGKVSTDAEVNALLTKFAEAKADDVITYGEVADIANVAVGSSRFKTITRRWRKIMLKQHNLEIRPQQGIGFVVLAPKDRVSANINDGLCLFKRVERTNYRLRVIPRHELSEHDVTRLDHATLLVARVADLGKTAAVQLALPEHKPAPVRPVPVEIKA